MAERFKNETLEIPESFISIVSYMKNDGESKFLVDELKRKFESQIHFHLALRFRQSPFHILPKRTFHYIMIEFNNLHRIYYKNLNIIKERQVLKGFMSNTPELSHVWNEISDYMLDKLMDFILHDSSIHLITKFKPGASDGIELLLPILVKLKHQEMGKDGVLQYFTLSDVFD